MQGIETGADLERWIRSVFVYRLEREEILRTVPHMLSHLFQFGTIEGDCDDISTFLAAFFLSMGIGVRFVAIRFGGSPDFGHVFLEWWNGRGWIILDPTVRPGMLYQDDERLIFYV